MEIGNEINATWKSNKDTWTYPCAAYGIKATVKEQLFIIISVILTLFILLTPNAYEAKGRHTNTVELYTNTRLKGLQEQILISYFEVSLLKTLALPYYAWPLTKDVKLSEVRPLLLRLLPALESLPDLSD